MVNQILFLRIFLSLKDTERSPNWLWWAKLNGHSGYGCQSRSCASAQTERNAGLGRAEQSDHKEGPMALRIGESGSGTCKAGLLLYLGSVGFQNPSLEQIWVSFWSLLSKAIDQWLRQGYLLSSLLSNIVIEVLTSSIKQEKKIQGMKIRKD